MGYLSSSDPVPGDTLEPSSRDQRAHSSEIQCRKPGRARGLWQGPEKHDMLLGPACHRSRLLSPTCTVSSLRPLAPATSHRLALTATPSCRWKLLFADHMPRAVSPHLFSPQPAGTADYHQCFGSSLCRPLFSNFSLLSHQSSVHPSCPRDLSLWPYIQLLSLPLPFEVGHLLPRSLLRNKEPP